MDVIAYITVCTVIAVCAVSCSFGIDRTDLQTHYKKRCLLPNRL